MPANEPDTYISYLPSRQIRRWPRASRTGGSPWLAHAHCDGAATVDHRQKAKSKRASPENQLHHLSTGSVGTWSKIGSTQVPLFLTLSAL